MRNYWFNFSFVVMALITHATKWIICFCCYVIHAIKNTHLILSHSTIILIYPFVVMADECRASKGEIIFFNFSFVVMAQITRAIKWIKNTNYYNLIYLLFHLWLWFKSSNSSSSNHKTTNTNTTNTNTMIIIKFKRIGIVNYYYVQKCFLMVI